MNPIFVDDVVSVIDAALRSQGHQLVNACGDDAATIRQIAESIGQAVGAEPIFQDGDGTAGDIVCTNREMKQAFGMNELMPLDDGLARTAAPATTVA
jgi:nucleoside-diphosphate-sugar epimerase